MPTDIQRSFQYISCRSRKRRHDRVVVPEQQVQETALSDVGRAEQHHPQPVLDDFRTGYRVKLRNNRIPQHPYVFHRVTHLLCPDLVVLPEINHRLDARHGRNHPRPPAAYQLVPPRVHTQCSIFLRGRLAL